MTKKYEVDSMLGDYYVKCGGSILFWGSRDKCNKVCDLLNEQDNEIIQLEGFKNKVFKEINTELIYLTERAMDNPVNRGRIKALKELKGWLNDGK